jgi:hypothetical protein
MKCFRNLLKQCKFKDNEDGKLCEGCRYEPKTNCLMVKVECDDTKCIHNVSVEDRLNNRQIHYCNADKIQMREYDNIQDWVTHQYCASSRYLEASK